MIILKFKSSRTHFNYWLVTTVIVIFKLILKQCISLGIITIQLRSWIYIKYTKHQPNLFLCTHFFSTLFMFRSKWFNTWFTKISYLKKIFNYQIFICNCIISFLEIVFWSTGAKVGRPATTSLTMSSVLNPNRYFNALQRPSMYFLSIV